MLELHLSIPVICSNLIFQRAVKVCILSKRPVGCGNDTVFMLKSKLNCESPNQFISSAILSLDHNMYEGETIFQLPFRYDISNLC